MTLNKPQEPSLMRLTCISYTLASSVIRYYKLFIIYIASSQIIIFILLYMDDIIVTRSNPSHVPELFLQLGKGFAMKDLVPLHFLLEIEVSIFKVDFT